VQVQDRDVVQSTGLQPLNHIAVDLHSPEPSYQQVARQLRERITSGEIGPREPLPSITRIVQETGLAVGTVRRAIDVLVKEGYAYTVPGRGTYAAAKPEVDG
jgi:DNA-binding GntR family transcriptional regulator